MEWINCLQFVTFACFCTISLQYDGPTCLSCQESVSPTDCRSIVHCSSHEKCYLDEYVTPNGHIRFNSGCRDSLQCSALHGRSVSNSFVDERSTSNTEVCSECCSDDLCNSGLCTRIGFHDQSMTTRGPICYNCPTHATVDDCEGIEICSRDESCFMHKTQDGRYSSSCGHTTACLSLNVIGKRQADPLCSITCCGTDLCNNGHNCTTAHFHACSSNPCVFGKCEAHENTYLCTCQLGYTGKNCDVTHPVNGEWSTWSTSSACSVSCGEGHETRTRTCNNPSPSHGGHTCDGQKTKTQTCNMQSCAVDGHWSTWSGYGACSVSCGDGKKTKTRSCNNPPASNGGHSCVGDSTHTNDCQTHVQCFHGVCIDRVPDCGPRDHFDHICKESRFHQWMIFNCPRYCKLCH